MNPLPASITWNCSHAPTAVRSATRGANVPRLRSADTCRPVAAALNQIVWLSGAAPRVLAASITVTRTNNKEFDVRRKPLLAIPFDSGIDLLPSWDFYFGLSCPVVVRSTVYPIRLRAFLHRLSGAFHCE